MSGGSLNYFYYQLEEHAGDFDDKELDELVKDLAGLFHDREWYLSGDTGKGDWRKSRDAFKEKWFTEHGRHERIEKYLDQLGDEVREMFGMSNKRCKACTYFKKKSDESEYGKCDFGKCRLMHEEEDCEKFEPGELAIGYAKHLKEMAKK